MPQSNKEGEKHYQPKQRVQLKTFNIFQHGNDIQETDMHWFRTHSIKKGLEEMGNSAKAETEQALYGCTSRERKRQACLPLSPTTRMIEVRKRK